MFTREILPVKIVYKGDITSQNCRIPEAKRVKRYFITFENIVKRGQHFENNNNNNNNLSRCDFEILKYKMFQKKKKIYWVCFCNLAIFPNLKLLTQNI